MAQDALKRKVAQAAVDFVLPMLGSDSILGVGTGSTVDFFIDLLAPYAQHFRGAVSSSERSSRRLSAVGVKIFDLNDIASMPVYVDGADEIDADLNMIKGGGGALTREKIVASVAEKFVCIVDESKVVAKLGAFALPIEIIPMAQEAVARQLTKLGGEPRARTGFITDNGGGILDVAGLDIINAPQLESRINDIPGVVTCGLFAIKGADVALVAGTEGVRTMTRNKVS